MSSAQPCIDPEQPFVLVQTASGGPRVAAANVAAETAGIAKGDRLADARAKAVGLQIRTLDAAANRRALLRLALWATRYTPMVAAWGEADGADGLYLDITGAAHLWGGEAALLVDLSGCLARFGLDSRCAIADTPGAAWALAHFSSSPTVVLPSEQERQALSPLPVEALRLAPEVTVTLRRLGFRRVGMLLDRPRHPFAARFETELLLRLDQALGSAPEALSFIAPPPVYSRLRRLMEPISSQEAVIEGAARLMAGLKPVLIRDGVGARRLRLDLYRVDGEVVSIDLAMAEPVQDPIHVARLLDLRLERTGEAAESGFGFEALRLTLLNTGKLVPRQVELGPGTDAKTRSASMLIDSLRHRLGSGSVRCLKPIASHIPERAEGACPSSGEAHSWPHPDEARLRPLLLLPRAEPAQVVAVVSDGPPRYFRWRGASRSVAHAQGPERIAGEWWHRSFEPTRDYYLIEDENGCRYWLYREGLYGRETQKANWFVHGFLG